MRCASSTWWRISRAQAWLSALTEANMVATQSTPPAMSRAKAPRGIEGEREEHHDQQREEEHGVDGFSRAPLDAEVFDEMGPEGAGHFVLSGSSSGDRGWSPTLAPEMRRKDGAPVLAVESLVRSAVLDFDLPSAPGGAEVVVGRENQLRAAGAGGDADLVEEDGGLVDVDGVGLSRAEEGDAAANVAGERLHVFERSHFGLAQAGGAGEFLEVELGVAGDDGEDGRCSARRWSAAS